MLFVCAVVAATRGDCRNRNRSRSRNRNRREGSYRTVCWVLLLLGAPGEVLSALAGRAGRVLTTCLCCPQIIRYMWHTCYKKYNRKRWVI